MLTIGGPLQFDQGPLGAPITAAPAAPKKKGGMFGSGLGVGEAIVAALNGYLAAKGNPVGVAGMQMMNQRHQLKLEESKYQNHRKDDMTDWIAQQAWKQAHPDPSNPHYFEDNSGNQMAIGPDGQPHVVYEDPNPWKFVPNGMGGVTPVNVRALMQGGQQPPQTLSDSDWPTQGGPPQMGAGGFPRPR